MLILHVLSWLYNADNQSLTLRFRQWLERLLSEWHEATYRDLRFLAAQFFFRREAQRTLGRLFHGLGYISDPSLYPAQS